MPSDDDDEQDRAMSAALSTFINALHEGTVPKEDLDRLGRAFLAISEERKALGIEPPANPMDAPDYRAPILSSPTLEQDTAPELKELLRGLSRLGREWVGMANLFMLQYLEKSRSHRLEIRGRELDDSWDGPTDNASLLKELDSYNVYGMKLAQLCLGLIARSQSMLIDVDIDELIKLIEPNDLSAEDRIVTRRIVWRTLMLISATSVIGERPYFVYDQVTKESERYACDQPLIRVTPWRRFKEGALKKGEVPMRLTIYAGPFLLRHAQNSQALPYCNGDILETLKLPNKRTVPAWTHRIRTNLGQFWREQAAKVKYDWQQKTNEEGDKENLYRKARFAPITRRQLLNEPCKVSPTVESILEDGKPGRLVDYCEAALKALGTGTLPPVSRYESFAKGKLMDWSPAARKKMGRQGWVDQYLDEELNLAPSQEILDSLFEIKESKPTPKKRQKRG